MCNMTYLVICVASTLWVHSLRGASLKLSRIFFFCLSGNAANGCQTAYLENQPSSTDCEWVIILISRAFVPLMLAAAEKQSGNFGKIVQAKAQ